MISAPIGAPGAIMAGKTPPHSNAAPRASAAALPFLPKTLPATLPEAAPFATAPGHALRAVPPTSNLGRMIAPETGSPAVEAVLPAAVAVKAGIASIPQVNALSSGPGLNPLAVEVSPEGDLAPAVATVPLDALGPISELQVELPPVQPPQAELPPVEPPPGATPTEPSEPPVGETPPETPVPQPPVPQPPVPAVPPTPVEVIARNAAGLAAGIARHDHQPSASARGIEQRSARATERTFGTPSPPPGPAAPTLDGETPVAAPVAELVGGGVLPVSANTDGGKPLSAPLPAQLPAPLPPPALAAGPGSGAAAPALLQLAARPEPAIGPSGPPIAFASPRFAEDVGIALARRVAAGGSTQEMVLRIEPADLGRIVIQLQFDERGALQAVLSADQPRVLEQLRHNAPELQRALADAVGRNDVAPLRFEGRGDAGSNGSNSSGFTGQQQSAGQGSGGGGQAQHRHLPFAPGHEVLGELPAAFQRLATVSSRLDLLA